MKLVSVVLMVCAAAGAARADAKADVDAAIRTHLKSVAGDTDLALAPAGLAYIDAGEFPATEGHNTGVSLGDAYSGNGAIVLGAMTVVVETDGHAARFHAPATFKFKQYVGEGITDWAKPPQPLRVSGIAIADGGAWKIARIAYTKPISDKDLNERATYEDPPLAPAAAPPKHTGDEAIAKAADSWFTAGFVKGAAPDAKALTANGTAPSEFATGAGALKLAKGWDALKLGATEIAAVAYGKLGWVTAKVRMPVKDPKTKKMIATELTLYAVVADDGAGGWKWQSINWVGR